MQTPGESPKPEQTGKILSFTLFCMLAAAIIGIAALMYAKSQNIDIRSINLKEAIGNILKEKKTEDNLLVEIKYDANEHPVFGVYKDYIVKCTKDGVKGISKNGEEEWSVPAPVNNPILKASAGYLLVADLGGRDIYVINGKDIKWNRKLERNIVNVDINDNGIVSAVQEVKGYKGAVSVFNQQGNELFTRVIAANYVLSSKVSPAGNMVAINSIDASGVYSRTNLELTDMMGKPGTAKIINENIIFPTIGFLGKDSILGVSDRGLWCFNKDGTEKWKQEFSNKTVSSAALWEGKNAAAAFKSENAAGIIDNNSTEVKIFNVSGKQTASINIDGEVKSLKASGDVIAAATGREVYFFNLWGKLLKKHISKSDIIGINIFSKGEALIVTKGSILIIKIS